MLKDGSFGPSVSFQPLANHVTQWSTHVRSWKLPAITICSRSCSVLRSRTNLPRDNAMLKVGSFGPTVYFLPLTVVDTSALLETFRN